MVWQMGPGRGSAFRGKSVHNQRVEQLWRDGYTKVLDLFDRLFFHLEDTNGLDINNPTHMMALHFTFQPRIQAALRKWANSYQLNDFIYVSVFMFTAFSWTGPTVPDNECE